MIRWLILLLMASKAGAQTVTQPGAALEAIKQDLESHGRETTVSSSSVFKYAHRMVAAIGCAVTFEVSLSDNINGANNRIESATLDLARMSPEVIVRRWSTKDSVWAIFVHNTSGRDDILITVSSNSGAETESTKLAHRWELDIDEQASATRVQNAMSSAITSCGGKRRTAVAQSRAVAQELKDSLSVVNLLKHSFGRGDTTYDKAKQICRDMIKPTLAVPSSADFPSEDSMLVVGPRENPTVFVPVDADNGLGVRVRTSHICTFKRYGNSWVPQGPPVLVTR